MMGNPYLRKHSAKSSTLRPLRTSGREMDLIPLPITKFDGGQNEEPRSLATRLRHQFPQVLVIECMLETMCAIYEEDTSKQKELYEILREHFVRFRLIPPTVCFPEMDSIRVRLGSDLNHLFRMAKLQVSTNGLSDGTLAVAKPSPIAGRVWSSVDGNEHLFTSRYEVDFKELEFIASGGFGVVYKAYNILDNNEYAIKKILIRPKSAEKIIREVQLLSQFHHPNIVAYKSAWLECCSPQTSHDILRRMSGNSSQGTSSTINISSSYASDFELNISSKRIDVSNKSDSVVFESDVHTETTHSESREDGTTSLSIVRSTHSVLFSRNWQSNQIISAPVMCLYIQMQLCQQTLRHWMNYRNSQKAELEKIDLELSIFRQIVQGIDYIHSRGIVHRDIKPENIFVNSTADQVQIGDFGLAVLGFNSDRNASSALSKSLSVRKKVNTVGVGTQTYAAPEQLNSRESDAKSDIYSLGILLLELLNPFKTVMERYKTIEVLRSLGKVPDEVHVKWPEMARLILKMISHERTSRPSAAEVITRLDLYLSATKTATTPLSSKLSKVELLLIIEDLKRQLAEKDLVIKELTAKKSE